MSQSPVDQFNKYVTSFVPKQQTSVTTLATAIIQLLIALYAVRFAPNLPKVVQDLFTNPIARFVIFFIVLVLAKNQPSTALVVAIAFLLTTNYINTGKVFEFMENTQDANSQLASQGVQSPEQAISDLNQPPQIVEGEVKLPPVVISSTIMTTEDGKQVVGTPQVIIAPKPVINGDQTVMMTPDVQVISSEQTATAPTPQPANGAAPAGTAAAPGSGAEVTPKEAVTLLAQAAASPNAVQPELVQQVADVAQSAVTTPEGAAAVTALAQQAAAPAAATKEQVVEVAQAAVQSMEATAAETPVPVKTAAETPKFMDIGCYASRRFDMSSVQPYESEFMNATV